MRKALVLVLAAALYLSWGGIERLMVSAPAADPGQSEVVLYATSWCGYCQKTRELLAEQRVQYVEYDIEKSEEGRRQHRALNGRGVPVLNIRGTIIHGYNRQAILAALKRTTP